jgi:hypothetical protein
MNQIQNGSDIGESDIDEPNIGESKIMAHWKAA